MASMQRHVSVLNFCRQKYAKALKLQEHYARQHLDDIAGKSSSTTPARNVLLYGDHEPVYTVGKRTEGYTKEEEDKLKALGCDFHRTNRGGLITFHGPGQLIMYPILNLRHFNIGMREYIQKLEKIVMKTCQFYGVETRITEDTGVWVEDKKICSIGVHGSRYVTTHGIALNCSNNLRWFKYIEPCGLKNKGVTSLTKETGHLVSHEDAAQHFLKVFIHEFHCYLEIDDEFDPANCPPKLSPIPE